MFVVFFKYVLESFWVEMFKKYKLQKIIIVNNIGSQSFLFVVIVAIVIYVTFASFHISK